MTDRRDTDRETEIVDSFTSEMGELTITIPKDFAEINHIEKGMVFEETKDWISKTINIGINAQIAAFDWKSQVESSNLVKLGSKGVFNVAYEAIRNRSTEAVTIDWLSKYQDTPSFRLFVHQMALLRNDPCTFCPKNPTGCKGCEYDENNDEQINKAVADLDSWRALNGCRPSRNMREKRRMNIRYTAKNVIHSLSPS